MKKAKCELCEKEAMYVPDAEDAENAFFAVELARPAPRVVLKCAYCGNEQRSSNVAEIHHAYHYGDVQRSFWTKVIAKEREKVARLQEGRW